MSTIRFQGKTVKVPDGYRALKKGEPIPNSFMFYSPSMLQWRHCMGPGGDAGYKQGSTFCPYPHAVPVALPAKSPRKSPKSQETSIQAHESQKDKAPLDRVRLLDRIRKYATGISCDRLEVLLGMKHQTASARLRDLAIAGKIVDSGRRETTSTGRKAICWKAVS